MNMLKKIIKNKSIILRERLKNSLYYFNRVKGAKKSWDRRHQRIIAENKNYYNPCDPQIESEHQELWSVFRKKPDVTTLRISSNISGTSDARIIPEDIYVADVEPSLIIDKSVDYIGIKSFYNKWFPNGIFPKDLFHRIDGQFFNAELKATCEEDLLKMAKNFKYPVVLKPNKDSYGGNDINIINNYKSLLDSVKNRSNFVVQEKIEQHEFFERLYPQSLNTIKVFLYRSVKDDKLYILSMALRMGKDGSLDNEAAGGINTFIHFDGSLNGYAVDKSGKKYLEHPNSGIKFDSKIPNIEELRSLSLKIGSEVFFTRIFALDACYDRTGKWRIIELNTYGQSIRFSQYGGQPFFGDFTNEVIEFTLNNHWALK